MATISTFVEATLQSWMVWISIALQYFYCNNFIKILLSQKGIKNEWILHINWNIFVVFLCTLRMCVFLFFFLFFSFFFFFFFLFFSSCFFLFLPISFCFSLFSLVSSQYYCSFLIVLVSWILVLCFSYFQIFYDFQKLWFIFKINSSSLALKAFALFHLFMDFPSTYYLN